MKPYPLDASGIAALRWACETEMIEPGTAARRALVDLGYDSISVRACQTLSAPASAASLVRDLLARAGVEDSGSFAKADGSIGYYAGSDLQACNCKALPWRPHEARVVHAVQLSEIPRLILALLDLDPGDKDGALQALRETGQ